MITLEYLCTLLQDASNDAICEVKCGYLFVTCGNDTYRISIDRERK